MSYVKNITIMMMCLKLELQKIKIHMKFSKSASKNLPLWSPHGHMLLPLSLLIYGASGKSQCQLSLSR